MKLVKPFDVARRLVNFGNGKDFRFGREFPVVGKLNYIGTMNVSKERQAGIEIGSNYFRGPQFIVDVRKFSADAGSGRKAGQEESDGNGFQHFHVDPHDLEGCFFDPHFATQMEQHL